MKKIIPTFALVLPIIANAAFTTSFGSKNGETSIALGLRGERIGIEFGYIDNTNWSGETLDYPVPHNNYTTLGKYKTGGDYGIDIPIFLNSTDLIGGLSCNWFSIYAAPGIYFGEEAELARSNATGWVYEQSSEMTIEATGEVGIMVYLPPNEASHLRLVIGAGYHTLRGPFGQIGAAYNF